ncbi:MAG: tetratricopeptide repeat protein [Flavobacteriaceae bacterium]
MENDRLLERVQVLIQHNRYIEAQKLMPQLLADNPNNSYVLALYSNILLQLNELERAIEVIDDAIGLAPDEDYNYYIKAVILLHKTDYDGAETNLKEAISLNPIVAGYYSYLGSIKLARKQFDEALKLADKALSLDPEDIDALNLRSSVLLKLNRDEESFETIEGALKEDPNNPDTHANYGWNLLEKGNPKKALIHFKEALKHNPNHQYAQNGMLEALKSKYLLYRWFLQYSFWIGKLTQKYQWGVVFGFYFGFKFIQKIADSNPSLMPVLLPIMIILGLMAFSTWVITPISNLFLRLNVYGRNLLDKKEILSSNFVGVSVLILFIGLIIYAITKNLNWLPIAFFGLVMMIPFSAMFAPTKYRTGIFAYIGLMVLLGIIAIFTTFKTDSVVNVFSFAFIISVVAFQWLANFLFIRDSNF